MPKTRKQKRDEAVERARHYTYGNSRAKRRGTKSEEQWAKEREAIINA